VTLSQLLILLAGYSFAFVTSGWVFRIVLKTVDSSKKEDSGEDARARSKSKGVDLGTVIGKCENFLAITLIAAGEVIGLALLFTAKSILRAEDVKNDPVYFLGGTLVNLCYSVLIGFVVRHFLTIAGA